MLGIELGGFTAACAAATPAAVAVEGRGAPGLGLGSILLNLVGGL